MSAPQKSTNEENLRAGIGMASAGGLVLLVSGGFAVKNKMGNQPIAKWQGWLMFIGLIFLVLGSILIARSQNED